jgi:hypothetical protein
MNIKLSYIITPVALIIAVISVSRVYALTGPQANAPIQSEISTPINNSSEIQVKKGSVTTKGDLGPLSLCGGVGNLNWGDYFPENSGQSFGPAYSANQVSPCIQGAAAIATGFLVSPWGFFTQIITSSVIVGSPGSQSADLPEVSEPVSADPTSMKLDLIGRGTENNSISGTQAINIYTNSCSTYTTITVDKPQITFNSSANSGTADLLARQVRLTAGNPQENSVLIKASSGSTWATLSVVNDQIELTPN